MKRKSLDVLKEVFKTIKGNPDITMSTLERKIRTNPHSLKEHCECLEYFGLIKIERTKETTKLRVFK